MVRIRLSREGRAITPHVSKTNICIGFVLLLLVVYPIRSQFASNTPVSCQRLPKYCYVCEQCDFQVFKLESKNVHNSVSYPNCLYLSL